MRCSVPGCLLISEERPPGVYFHRFPSDGQMVKKWLHIIKPEVPTTSVSLVCSNHFAKTDYIGNSRKKLLSSAVPTLNLKKEDTLTSAEDVTHGDSDSQNVQEILKIKCSVPSCNVTKIGDKMNFKMLSIIRFPTKQSLVMKWCKTINRSGWKPKPSDFVCSRHFAKDAFEVKQGQKRLKAMTLPSLCLDEETSTGNDTQNQNIQNEASNAPNKTTLQESYTEMSTVEQQLPIIIVSKGSPPKIIVPSPANNQINAYNSVAGTSKNALVLANEDLSNKTEVNVKIQRIAVKRAVTAPDVSEASLKRPRKEFRKIAPKIAPKPIMTVSPQKKENSIVPGIAGVKTLSANMNRPWSCCVFDCVNSSKMPFDRDLSLYKFPINAELTEKWFNFCTRDSLPFSEFPKFVGRFICSDHFRKSDFISAHRLHPNTVPTIVYKLVEEGDISERRPHEYVCVDGQLEAREIDSSQIRKRFDSSNQSEAVSSPTFVISSDESDAEISNTRTSKNVTNVKRIVFKDDSAYSGRQGLIELKKERKLLITYTNDQRSKLQKAKQERASLRNEIVELRMENHKIQRHLNDVREENLRLKEVIAEKDKSNETYSNKLAICDAHNNELNDKITILSRVVVHKTNLLEENEKEMKLLKEAISQLKSKPPQVDFKVQAYALFKDALSKNQINVILKKQRCKEWTCEEICNAICLRYLSPACSDFLQQKMNYPLPAKGALCAYVSRLSPRGGILNDMITLMKVSNFKKPFDAMTVLSFDEMEVQQSCEFDKNTKNLFGPYKTMQIVLARSVISEWMQPIYVGFNSKITKEILLLLIEKLHKIGYKVIACTSKYDQNLIELWKSMEIGLEKTHFNHPLTEEKIYCLCDVPDLLRQLRSSFVENTIKQETGELMTTELIQQLIDKSLHKRVEWSFLTNCHLSKNVTPKKAKQFAVELFSDECASALTSNFPYNIAASNLALFINNVSTWFKTMHSSQRIDLQADESYTNILDDAHRNFSNLHFVEQTETEPYLHAILLTTRNMNEILNEMKSQNRHFVWTHRFSNDQLNYIFTALRANVKDGDNPTPLTALSRLKLLILGKALKRDQNPNGYSRNFDTMLTEPIFKDPMYEAFIKEEMSEVVAVKDSQEETNLAITNIIKQTSDEDNEISKRADQIVLEYCFEDIIEEVGPEEAEIFIENFTIDGQEKTEEIVSVNNESISPNSLTFNNSEHNYVSNVNFQKT